METLQRLVDQPEKDPFEEYFVMQDVRDLGKIDPSLVARFAFHHVLDELFLPSPKKERIFTIYHTLKTDIPDLELVPSYLGLEPKRLEMFQRREFLRSRRRLNMGSFLDWTDSGIRLIRAADESKQLIYAWKKIFGVTAIDAGLSITRFVDEFNLLPMMFQVMVFELLENPHRDRLLSRCVNPCAVVFHVLRDANKIQPSSLEVMARHARPALEDVLFTKLAPREMRALLMHVSPPPSTLLMCLLYRRQQYHRGTADLCEDLVKEHYSVCPMGIITKEFTEEEVQLFKATTYFRWIQQTSLVWCFGLTFPKEINQHICGFI
jgi:hypothetical protein